MISWSSSCSYYEHCAWTVMCAVRTWVFELLSHDAKGGHLLLQRGMDDHHWGAQDAH